MGANESKIADAGNQKPGFKAPENDYQLVFEAIKCLEHTLIQKFDSNGDTLHEMISTTNEKLPLELIIDMRALATVRNNLAHEYSCDGLPEREAFIEKYRSCVERLDQEVNKRTSDEKIFYQEVVQKHRQLHPRPTFIVEDAKTAGEEPIQKSAMSCVACF